jgi:hypothetical protein
MCLNDQLELKSAAHRNSAADVAKGQQAKSPDIGGKSP